MTLEIFIEPQGGVHFKTVVEPHRGSSLRFSVSLMDGALGGFW